MSKKLEILERSLLKKEEEFTKKLEIHFSDVKSANGQPLNDKRNGWKTFDRWERQNDSLRNLNEGIEKTKIAIKKEQHKCAYVEHVSQTLPREILELIQNGSLIQWRKHPNTFFVPGIEKARIVFDEKKQIVAHRYISTIIDSNQRTKFAQVYNSLHKIFNKR
jgi:hypothetical protein